ncbi:MAG: hypothetical protein AMR96_04375 [Candidatus Adiutrix intracellularis]|nr:MAG: hypothetical protein AMR96_04375 [Candidatus Adiutrix intracellularis]
MVNSGALVKCGFVRWFFSIGRRRLFSSRFFSHDLFEFFPEFLIKIYLLRLGSYPSVAVRLFFAYRLDSFGLQTGT